MKLQLIQMQQAESVQDNDSTAIDTRLLYAGGIVVLGGLAFLAYKRFNNVSRTPEIQMSPVKPRLPIPPQQNLDMD